MTMMLAPQRQSGPKVVGGPTTKSGPMALARPRVRPRFGRMRSRVAASGPVRHELGVIWDARSRSDPPPARSLAFALAPRITAATMIAALAVGGPGRRSRWARTSRSIPSSRCRRRPAARSGRQRRRGAGRGDRGGPTRTRTATRAPPPDGGAGAADRVEPARSRRAAEPEPPAAEAPAPAARRPGRARRPTPARRAAGRRRRTRPPVTAARARAAGARPGAGVPVAAPEPPPPRPPEPPVAEPAPAAPASQPARAAHRPPQLRPRTEEPAPPPARAEPRRRPGRLTHGRRRSLLRRTVSRRAAHDASHRAARSGPVSTRAAAPRPSGAVVVRRGIPCGRSPSRLAGRGGSDARVARLTSRALGPQCPRIGTDDPNLLPVGVTLDLPTLERTRRVVLHGPTDRRARRRLGASLAIAAPAHGAAVLTTGQLTGAGRAAVSGEVRVYAWPRRRRRWSFRCCGSATAAADGRFSVAASDDRALLRLARPRGGWLDFTAVADAAGRQGRDLHRLRERRRGRVRVVTPEDAAPARASPAWRASRRRRRSGSRPLARCRPSPAPPRPAAARTSAR